MIADCISTSMMYSTIRICCEDSIGTGFFFLFNIGEKQYPIIITNQHVIKYNKDAEVSFCLNLMNEDGSDGGKYILNLNTFWVFHPSRDLCFTFANQIITEIERRANKKVRLTYLSNDLIPSKETLESLRAIEEVVT